MKTKYKVTLIAAGIGALGAIIAALISLPQSGPNDTPNENNNNNNNIINIYSPNNSSDNHTTSSITITTSENSTDISSNEPENETTIFSDTSDSSTTKRETETSSDTSVTTKNETTKPVYTEPEKQVVSIIFNANGGIVDTDLITAYFGDNYGTLPTPKRDYFTFDGWYTLAVGGSLINETTKVNNSNSHTLYAHWNKVTVNVSLDSNGGNTFSNTMTVFWGDNYESLPTPQRDYYSFEGWYTSVNGGSLVTENTIVNNYNSHTLYAHWKYNNVSDWVLSSQIPLGAEIVEEKWRYTRTEIKESENSSEPGWNLTGNYWIPTETGINTYADFPSNSNGIEYYNTSDQLYISYGNNAFTDYEYDEIKREITDIQLKSYIYYHWVYPLSGYHTETNREVGLYNGEWINNGGYANIWESFEGGYVEYSSWAQAYEIRGHSTYSYWWVGGIPVYTQAYTDYIKIYQYKKESKLESPYEITEGNEISNVQKYVRYRAR